jgi:hypothetical protein
MDPQQSNHLAIRMDAQEPEAPKYPVSTRQKDIQVQAPKRREGPAIYFLARSIYPIAIRSATPLGNLCRQGTATQHCTDRLPLPALGLQKLKAQARCALARSPNLKPRDRSRVYQKSYCTLSCRPNPHNTCPVPLSGL